MSKNYIKTEIGYYFKNFFDPEKNYFDLITSEHSFQVLSESDKTTLAYRKGIYLSKVEKVDPEDSENIKEDPHDSENSEDSDSLKFNLLRCSTNFVGPTDNFRKTDVSIIDSLNETVADLFTESSQFNHVLAQIYNNYKIEEKEKKAKIKEHSDKTKDMPKNGLIAFCTFYKDIDINADNTYKNVSTLTKLRFRNKLNREIFDVLLEPNSVLIITLETNRNYTHEIVPSTLPIDKVPIRLGYVVRCSNTEAIYNGIDNCVYIKDALMHTFTKLGIKNDLDVEGLKLLYYKENTTTEEINYKDINTNFSLNNGDYLRPII